mmetsp:Transcript_37416/g.106137  ORF Transcript_37416/g.106137 Transcript_37416/m.106137 type:complete len:204 (+) Transcript_37416:402-1013(+)
MNFTATGLPFRAFMQLTVAYAPSPMTPSPSPEAVNALFKSHRMQPAALKASSASKCWAPGVNKNQTCLPASSAPPNCVPMIPSSESGRTRAITIKSGQLVAGNAAQETSPQKISKSWRDSPPTSKHTCRSRMWQATPKTVSPASGGLASCFVCGKMVPEAKAWATEPPAINWGTNSGAEFGAKPWLRWSETSGDREAPSMAWG